MNTLKFFVKNRVHGNVYSAIQMSEAPIALAAPIAGVTYIANTDIRVDLSELPEIQDFDTAAAMRRSQIATTPKDAYASLDALASNTTMIAANYPLHEVPLPVMLACRPNVRVQSYRVRARLLLSSAAETADYKQNRQALNWMSRKRTEEMQKMLKTIKLPVPEDDEVSEMDLAAAQRSVTEVFPLPVEVSGQLAIIGAEGFSAGGMLDCVVHTDFLEVGLPGRVVFKRTARWFAGGRERSTTVTLAVVE